MIYGIGCDIIEVSRIEKSASKESFCERVYSEEEREYFLTLKYPYMSMAGTWAAKEAFSKALGTGVRGFSLNEITVSHDNYGKPYFKLVGKAARCAEGLSLQLSISHTREYAQAFCIACMEKGE